MKPNFTKLPKDFTIHEATISESATILNEPQILANLRLKDSTSITGEGHTYYIISYKEYKAMFSFWETEKTPGLYEVHTAIPKNSLRACRLLILAAMDWGFREGCPGVKAYISSAPEGKIANFLRKLGFRELNAKAGNKLIFMYINRRVTS